MNNKKCEICGSTDVGTQNKFCSRECYAKHRSINYSGVNHQDYEEKESRTCKNCGEDFNVKSYKDKKFCTKRCSEKYMTGKNHPNYNNIEAECDNCGNVFKRAKSKVDLYDKHYCDRKCRYKDMEDNLMENSPAWVSGAKTYRGPKWDEKRQEILEEYDYKCKKCGVKNKKHKKTKGFGLDIHHLTNFREFDSYEDANTKENLVALCRSCHIEEEMSDGSGI